MKITNVNWQYAEERPEKIQKVEGRFLLDLRSKINDMEQQLKTKNEKLLNTSNDLNATKEKLKNTEKNLKEKTEDVSRLEKDVEK